MEPVIIPRFVSAVRQAFRDSRVGLDQAKQLCVCIYTSLDYLPSYLQQGCYDRETICEMMVGLSNSGILETTKSEYCHEVSYWNDVIDDYLFGRVPLNPSVISSFTNLPTPLDKE